MSGKDWMKLSSAALNSFKVGIDLISFGRMLYIADADDEKELNLIVLIPLNFDFPRGRRHITPLLGECWKTILMLLGIILL